MQNLFFEMEDYRDSFFTCDGIVVLSQKINDQQFYAIQLDGNNGTMLTCIKSPKTIFTAEQAVPLDLSKKIGQKINVQYSMRDGNVLYGVDIIYLVNEFNEMR